MFFKADGAVELAFGPTCTRSVSAQVGLPAWVRGRGLALFVTVQFGAMSFGC
jgi:hypothetical protein